MAKGIELVYRPLGQPIIHLRMDYTAGLCISEVLNQSGLLQSHPEIQAMPVGIFSKVVPLSTQLKPGDRIEIYTPLLVDPKEKRRQRASQKKS